MVKVRCKKLSAWFCSSRYGSSSRSMTSIWRPVGRNKRNRALSIINTWCMVSCGRYVNVVSQWTMGIASSLRDFGKVGDVLLCFDSIFHPKINVLFSLTPNSLFCNTFMQYHHDNSKRIRARTIIPTRPMPMVLRRQSDQSLYQRKVWILNFYVI